MVLYSSTSCKQPLAARLLQVLAMVLSAVGQQILHFVEFLSIKQYTQSKPDRSRVHYRPK